MIGFGNPLLNGPDSGYAASAKLAREKQSCPKTAWRRCSVCAMAWHRLSTGGDYSGRFCRCMRRLSELHRAFRRLRCKGRQPSPVVRWSAASRPEAAFQ
jgi:hypothetical protein